MSSSLNCFTVARLTTRSTTMSVDVAMRKVAMPITTDTLESLASRGTDLCPSMRYLVYDVDATGRQKIRADVGGRSGEDGKGIVSIITGAKGIWGNQRTKLSCRGFN
jgi:hypothetical protein